MYWPWNPYSRSHPPYRNGSNCRPHSEYARTSPPFSYKRQAMHLPPCLFYADTASRPGSPPSHRRSFSSRTDTVPSRRSQGDSTPQAHRFWSWHFAPRNPESPCPSPRLPDPDTDLRSAAADTRSPAAVRRNRTGRTPNLHPYAAAAPQKADRKIPHTCGSVPAGNTYNSCNAVRYPPQTAGRAYAHKSASRSTASSAESRHTVPDPRQPHTPAQILPSWGGIRNRSVWNVSRNLWRRRNHPGESRSPFPDKHSQSKGRRLPCRSPCARHTHSTDN